MPGSKSRAVMLAVAFVSAMLAQPQIARAQNVPDSAVTPVIAATVTRRDMPVYVTGIGTVQAFNAVSVKSRVDGQIMKVLFEEGQEVKAGAPLFQIDPRPFQAALDQAMGTKRKDQGQLDGAGVNLTRYNQLLGKGFQTKQSVDDQKALVAQLQGGLAADDAAIEIARLNLSYALVRAPINGRTGARLVDLGNFVQANAATPLVSITEIKPVYVRFTVPQDHLDDIRESLAAGTATVVAYAADNTKRLSTGKLSLIDNQVDPATGTIRLKASFPNTDERLWPGAFVNARLLLGTKKDVVTVADRAVMQGATGYYAFVIKPDNTVERRNVHVTPAEGGMMVVTDGLAAAEKIVLDGQYRLIDGAKISITPAKSPIPATEG